jgi:hypothetical protein
MTKRMQFRLRNGWLHVQHGSLAVADVSSPAAASPHDRLKHQDRSVLPDRSQIVERGSTLLLLVDPCQVEHA